MHSSCHLYFHNTLEDFILFLSLSMFSNYSLMAKHDLVLGTQRGLSHSLSSLKVYTWLHMFRGFWFIDPFETPIFCEKKNILSCVWNFAHDSRWAMAYPHSKVKFSCSRGLWFLSSTENCRTVFFYSLREE